MSPDTRRVPVKVPWKGIISDYPTQDDPTAFDDVLNFFMRKGRIQTRPQLSAFTSTSIANELSLQGAPFLMTTFIDVVNQAHTLVLFATAAFYLTSPNVLNALNNPSIGGLFSGFAYPGNPPTFQPYAYVSAVNKVFFTNGSNYLMYTDGSQTLSYAGDTPGGAFFMDIDPTGSSLIMADTVEVVNSTIVNFPQRVRWSASGLPLEWDPTVNISAGANDLLGVSDEITGLATLGAATYIYRQNGISVMFFQGSNFAPFAFENLSSAPAGIGNFYPYSLAKYKDMAVFISQNDVHLQQQGGFSSIAKNKNKKRLFADLAGLIGNVYGAILPGLGPGYDFLSYWLSIPGTGVTWVYSFDDDNWTRINTPNGIPTFIQTVGIS